MINIALISDSLTRECLIAQECNITIITPSNYKKSLTCEIDLLFIESAWIGVDDDWKYKVASYPRKSINRFLNFFGIIGNYRLKKAIDFAKSKNIPTIFWNKEDPVHYDRFIDSARLCDFIFTVDELSIPRYKEDTNAIIDVLPFAVQEKFHFYNNDISGTNGKANFVGSYGNPNHVARKFWQDFFFKEVPLFMHLDIYDRNSDRKQEFYRFKEIENTTIKDKISNENTAEIYRGYDLSINVNTVENSTTMFSRRLIEIIACGGIAITNDSPAVQRYFKDYCYVVSTEKDFFDVLDDIKDGVPEKAKERAVAGAKYIAENHTWGARLRYIEKVIGYNSRT